MDDIPNLHYPVKLSFINFMVEQIIFEYILKSKDDIKNPINTFLPPQSFRAYFTKNILGGVPENDFNKISLIFKNIDLKNIGYIFEGFFANRFQVLILIYSSIVLDYLFHSILYNIFTNKKNLKILNLKKNNYKHSTSTNLGYNLLSTKINVIHFATIYIKFFLYLLLSPFFQLVQFIYIFVIYIFFPYGVFLFSIGVFLNYDVFTISDIYTFLMVTCVNFFKVNLSINISNITKIIFYYINYTCGDSFIFFKNFKLLFFPSIFFLMRFTLLLSFLAIVLPIIFFKFFNKNYFKYKFTKNYFDKNLKIKNGWTYEEFSNFLTLFTNYNHSIFFYSSYFIRPSKSKYFYFYFFKNMSVYGIFKELFKNK